MPSKDMKCEFCEASFRKNELARHTKAKHKNELAQFILEEYIENPNMNCLQRYAKGLNPNSNPVWSKLYNDGRYYFGANPTFFEEDDDASSYKKSEENMKLHNEFLTELVRSISLLDFLQAERIIQINSEQVVNLKKEKRKIDELYEKSQEEVESLKKSVEYLQGVVADFKEATECSTTISIMKDELRSVQSSMEYYKNECENRIDDVNILKEKHQIEIENYIEDTNQRIRKLNKQLDDCMEENYKMKEERESLTTKRESVINTRLEKERTKLKDQFEKEKEKLEKELKKKYKSKISKLEDKLVKIKLKSKDSDSDSDSDSD
jgi:chromosome segregation ATPase